MTKKSSIRIYTLICAIVIVIQSGSALWTTEKKEAKCNYEDTVDITESTHLSNGSYLFRGHLIPPELMGLYDYEIVFESEKVPVELHLRGCICKVTSCVQFCCHPKENKIEDARECSPQSDEEMNYSPWFNVTDSDGTTHERDLLNEFFIQQRLPCEKGFMYFITSNRTQLMENGTLLYFGDEHNPDKYSKNEYCLMKGHVDKKYILGLHICIWHFKRGFLIKFSLLIISIPFMLATICVYAFIRELRNLHGKCLIAYLAAMTIGNILYNILPTIIQLEEGVSDEVCSVLGYSTYFFIVSGFFWLSIISFDLWYNFRSTTAHVSRLVAQRRYYIYSLVAWLFPAIFTAATILAQFSNLDPHLKPGIGTERCWINDNEWSAMIYFYGPMIISVIFNSTMFVLTYSKIYNVQNELRQFGENAEQNRHSRRLKDDFNLFLRLFVIMGVTWVFEVLGYLGRTYSIFFDITDALNSSMGITIFVLFVLKRRVVMLIRKRMCRNSGVKQSEMATKTSELI